MEHGRWRSSLLFRGRRPVTVCFSERRGSPFASELCSVVYSGRVAMRAAVQPSITGMNPGGRRPTVPRTLVESDRSRRASAGAQVLYTVLGERERGCRMGTQASKLPRRSRSALRVVGGVLGAMAREVVGDRCDGVLCALGQSRSTHGQVLKGARSAPPVLWVLDQRRTRRRTPRLI